MDPLVGLRAKARAELEEKAASGDAGAQRRIRTNDLERETLRCLREGAAAGDAKAQDELSGQRAYRNRKTREWEAKDKVRRDANDGEAIARFEEMRLRGRERALEYAAKKRAAASSALPSERQYQAPKMYMTKGRKGKSDIRHFFEPSHQKTDSGFTPQLHSHGEQGARSSIGEDGQSADLSRAATPLARKSRAVRLPPQRYKAAQESMSKMRGPASTDIEQSARKEPVTKQSKPSLDRDGRIGDATIVVVDDDIRTNQLAEASASFQLSDGNQVDRERAALELEMLQKLWEKTDIEEKLAKARSSAMNF